MYRVYCDVCGQEIPPQIASERIAKELGNVRAEVLVAVDKVWNAGHVCRPCLMRVLNEGRDLNRKELSRR